MVTGRLAIHVLPDSNPTNVSQMIQRLSSESLAFSTAKELIDYLRESGQNTNEWVQSTSTSMGILHRTTEGIKLSSSGLALSQVREDVRGDLLHFLMYSGWSVNKPHDFLQSWAYRLVCDQFWELGQVELTPTYLDRLVGEIINIAQGQFSETGAGQIDGVSFSRKSLKGVQNWLEAVHPPVIESNTFKRRSFCSPELVIMAIGYSLRDEVNTTGVDILLSPPKREIISKICLLDADALDRALDWAIPIFPNIISAGTTAGFYGRFIRLHKIPALEDLVR